MRLKGWRIISFSLMGAGLFLLLLSGPAPFLFGIYYDNQIIDLFRSWGIPLRLRGLLLLILTILSAALGSSIWFPLWKLLRLSTQSARESQFPGFETTTLKLYLFWTVFLVALSILGDLVALLILFLMIISALIFTDYPPALTGIFLLLVFAVVYTSILLGHILMALLIGRSHWRLLQGERRTTPRRG